MSEQFVRVEVADHLAVLTLDRPKALNALNSQMLTQLEEALTSVAENPSVRALILTGAGPKAFVAGADIAEMADFSPEKARDFTATGHRILNRLGGMPFPTVAAVNGFALGGGCELALACDLLYASENAKFGLPEVGLGVIPGFGGTQRLTRQVGRARAKELIFTGDIIDAARAKQVGLALEIVPQDKLLEHCRDVARRIAQKAPVAVAEAKRVIERGADQELSAANELEKDAFAGLFKTADQREGMKAFLEKRQPAFVGK